MTIRGRKSHVKRCFGVIKNDDGTTDDDFDTWLDLLRTDEFQYITSDGQGYKFIIKWADDTLKEDTEDYDNLAGIDKRKTELGKGTDPELPYDPDPDQYVPFRVIKELVISDSAQGEKVKYIFKNRNVDENGVQIPTPRKVDIVRVYHSDTLNDDDLNDENGTHIVADEDYQLKPDSQDKGQYADIEVIKNWTHKLHKDVNKPKVQGQDEKVILHNADVYLDMLQLVVTDNISPGTNSSGDPTIPARMDPFQNILNVQWGGLAVEFFQGASPLPPTSYIEVVEGVPDTKQFTFSLWFRIPQTSLDKAKAEATAQTFDPKNPDMKGIIPLVVFGQPNKVRGWKFPSDGGPVVGSTTSQNWFINPLSGPKYTPIGESTPIITRSSQAEWDSKQDTDELPSYVGIAFVGNRAVLDIKISMPQSNPAVMEGGNNWGKVTSVEYSAPLGLYLGAIEDCVVENDGPLIPRYTIHTRHDTSNAQFAVGSTVETFRTCYPGGLPPPTGTSLGGTYRTYTGPTITADHWHHLVCSIDLNRKIELEGGFIFRRSQQGCEPVGGNCTDPDNANLVVSSREGKVAKAVKMYVALDDVNLTGDALSVYRGNGCGPNDVITTNGLQMCLDAGVDLKDVECVRFARQQTDWAEAAVPTYKYTPAKFQFDGNSVAFPVRAKNKTSMKHVEMGEFQLFTDTVVDTGIEANRRLFITKEGKPEHMSVAEDALQKKPDMKLHGAGNWKVARNTGTSRPTPPPEEVVVGKIKVYVPNPNLNGKQGDPQ